MFPDRVGRVVLDGVVDADLYVSPMWSDSIRDADASKSLLFEKFLLKSRDYKLEAMSYHF